MEHDEKHITVSVIIPVCQVSAYIERCVRSVMRQTFPPFECLLVDDATQDDSISQCERLVAGYDGPILFRILHHEQKRGLSAARNTGIDAATGDYLLFVDSDDMLSDDCVEQLLKPAERDPSVQLVMGSFSYFSDRPMPTRLKQPEARQEEDFPTPEAVRDLYLNPPRSIPPAAWNKLTSRQFINSHRLRFEDGLIWEDALWTFLEMKHLSHVYVIPAITYHYYYRPYSITYGTRQATLLHHGMRVCDLVSSQFTPGDEAREARLFFARFCFAYAELAKTAQLRDICRRFRRALSWRQYPREKLLLAAADLLPRNSIGRRLFRFLKNRLSRASDRAR